MKNMKDIENVESTKVGGIFEWRYIGEILMLENYQKKWCKRHIYWKNLDFYFLFA